MCCVGEIVLRQVQDGRGKSAELLLAHHDDGERLELNVRYILDGEDEQLWAMQLDFPFADLDEYLATGAATFGLNVDDTVGHPLLFGWVGTSVSPEKLTQLGTLTGYAEGMADEQGFVLRWL
jgi:hypothetical protein